MRKYQKRRRLHMLIAILMSLNIVSVGYATWAITGPSTDTTDGGFVSYPVIKSDEYYTLTTAINFQSYFNKGSQGYFFLVDTKGDPAGAYGDNAKTATITLTYTKKEALTNPEITTTIVFGDTAKTKSFFTTATISAIKVQGSDGSNIVLSDHNQLTAKQEGVLTFTFVPKGDKTTVTITLTATGAFDMTALDAGAVNFIFNTTVQGTPN